MLPKPPAQLLLLAIVGLIAYAAIRNLYKYYTQDPAERDVEQTGKNRGWLNKQKPGRNIVALIALFAFSVFIFTKTATDFARGPMFTPFIVLLVGAVAMLSALRGLATGKIVPMISRMPSEVDQTTRPRSFWFGMTWNGLIGFFMLIMGFAMVAEASRPKFADICSGPDSKLQNQETLAACAELAADPFSRRKDPAPLTEDASVGLPADPQHEPDLGDEALAATWNSWAYQPRSDSSDTSAAR